ncbi:MAG: 2-C-methyl-D-erythritol 4-phosphate cytidylyltransferase [Gammaproteobacteria bacterium]|nr:2-C-methyl-D-erythritol 4-phosphate cytidylyltransferase [Gammaproteobacteria bacterium]
MTSLSSDNCWAVIPAAGTGSRMGAAIPKQYLPLLGSTVIEHTVRCFLNHPLIKGVVVVIAPHDVHWKQLPLQGAPSLLIAEGGVERYHSVLNGLAKLAGIAQPHDWVLVHDAARPCVRHDDIDHLIATLADHPVGGLLGVPVSDTVKRADSQGNVAETVSRVGLWRALTPQMFRLDDLSHALRHVVDNKLIVTDEAAAMELAGFSPRMVSGHADNIKITHPQDLALAELYLKQQENQP